MTFESVTLGFKSFRIHRTLGTSKSLLSFSGGFFCCFGDGFCGQAVVFGRVSTTEAVFVDRRWFLGRVSTTEGIFVDRRWFSGRVSTAEGIFVDRRWFLWRVSTTEAVFEAGVHGRGGFCGQAVVSSATYHPAGRGTNAAIQMGALKTRGQMRVMVLVPALSGIRAGSCVQKNCSSV